MKPHIIPNPLDLDAEVARPLFAFLLTQPAPTAYQVTEFIGKQWPMLPQASVYNITQQCKSILAALQEVGGIPGVAEVQALYRQSITQNKANN